jgi:drug/metabolite transporter (DMT)-like permease
VIYLNYVLLAVFVVSAIGWFVVGDRMQALYWFGASVIQCSVTFR